MSDNGYYVKLVASLPILPVKGIAIQLLP